MTLPTSRIDSLTPPSRPSMGVELGDSPLNGSDTSQSQILLVDFEPRQQLGLPVLRNGVGEDASSSASMSLSLSSSVSVPEQSPSLTSQALDLGMFPNSYKLPVQVQPQSITSTHATGLHVGRGGFNDDLSNYTLVNLSNHQNDYDGPRNVHSGPELLRQTDITPSPPNGRIPGVRHLPSSAMYSAVGNRMSSGKLSSSCSSSDDSDTGFLVSRRGESRNNKGLSQFRLPKSRKEETIPLSPVLPGAGTGTQDAFQPRQRRRLKRRRSTIRKNGETQNMEGELFPLCCCAGEEEHFSRQSPRSTTGPKYLRFICAIVVIIFIATFTSIMVSLQRKVDSLSLEVVRLSSAAGSSGKLVDNPQNSSSITQDLTVKQEMLNSTILSLLTRVNEVSERLSTLEKQPSIDDVRNDLARLGSEMKGSIEELQKEIQAVKKVSAEENTPREQPLYQGTGPSSPPAAALVRK